MAIERFLGETPESQKYLRMIVLREQGKEASKGNMPSPVRVIARQLIKDGKDSLGEVFDSFSLGGKKKVDKEAEDKTKNSIGAILLGNIIIEIEDMLWTGVINLPDFSGRCIAATRASLLKDYFSHLPSTVEDISGDEKHKQMLREAEKDKTLSVFIENPDLLPDNFRDFIFVDPRLSLLVKRILPAYKKAAEFCVAEFTQKQNPRGVDLR